MDSAECSNEKVLYSFFLAVSLVMLAAAFFAGPTADLFPGFLRILASPQVLTTDACAVGGLGGALLNAGLLGVASWALMKYSGSEPSGASMGAFFLTLGFSFFGKNCLNIWPIVLGTWLYAIFKKEPFGKHVNMSLFACSLAPFVSEALFNRNLDYSTGIGIAAALIIGCFIGLVFPAITAHTVNIHKGHNLFNAGVSAGFLAFLLFTIYKTLLLRPLGLEGEYALNSILSEGYPAFFSALVGIIFIGAILAGFLLSGKSFAGYRRLLQRSGYKTEFLALDGVGSALINFGVLGFVCLAYFLITGAPFTGPTVGAFLCILCWAGTGSHPRNVIPIMIGYWLISLRAAWGLNTQAIAVAFCFATGLSPISGRWGWWWGIAAGALHSCIACYTPAIYGGFNIYNGGFVSGLTALILIPVLETFCKELSLKNSVQRAESAKTAVN